MVAAGHCTLAAAGRLVQVAIAASLGRAESVASLRPVSYTFWVAGGRGSRVGPRQ